MSTWFAIHVRPGAEERAVEILRPAAEAGGLEELFCPMSHGVRRQGEELVGDTRPTFEGCVFAVAPSKWELRACMRRADGLECLLDGHPSFDALEEGEASFVDSLAAPGERAVAMSEGVVDGGRTVVVSGPLRGREQEIRKYSTHNRWAYLEASVAGRPVIARAGLRVTRKR